MKVGFSAVLLAVGLVLGSATEAQAANKHLVARGSRPTIQADIGGHLHVAFEAFQGANKVPDILYTKSTDHGVNWSPPKNISMTPGVSQHADIAVEKSGAVDVVWVDNSSDPKSPDIYFARSTDSGQTWTKPTDISSSPGVSAQPAIAMGQDDAIHVIFSDTTKGESNKDIYYVCSRDGGEKWSPAIDISNTPGASYDPALSVSAEGTVHAAWADTTTGDSRPDIYYVQSKNDTWTKPTNVSNSPRVSTHPTIACSRGNVYLSWSDNSRKEDAADIWLVVGGPNGKFGNPLNMSDTPGVSTEPRAAALGDDLAIVWSDTSSGTKTPSIYGIASHDNAGDFSTWFNVSNARNMDKHPDITIIGDRMYAIWEEITLANEESVIKTGSVDIKELATGPPLYVDPKLHGVSGNMH